jgi:four helix bundle protein
MGIERFEELDVWKTAHGLVLNVYRTTKAFPAHERFGLVSQMRRAAASVPANIAEGFKRRGQANKAHFYNMAEASLEELRYYFILCRDLGYELEHAGLTTQAERVSRICCLVWSRASGLTHAVDLRRYTAYGTGMGIEEDRMYPYAVYRMLYV